MTPNNKYIKMFEEKCKPEVTDLMGYPNDSDTAFNDYLSEVKEIIKKSY